VYDLVIDVAAGRHDVTHIATALQRLAQPRP
jgi:hypothetical protein